MDASISVSFCPPPATASAEGAQFNVLPFPVGEGCNGGEGSYH